MSEALTLPVPGDILTVIVDFLYADDSPYVNSKCLSDTAIMAMLLDNSYFKGKEPDGLLGY